MLPLLVNGKFASDCCEKGNLFSNFLASVCTPIKKSRILPLFSHRANVRITLFHFTKEDRSLIMKILDQTKTHGCESTSLKMTKICSQSLTASLRIIFNQSLKEGKFPDLGKNKCSCK